MWQELPARGCLPVGGPSGDEDRFDRHSTVPLDAIGGSGYQRLVLRGMRAGGGRWPAAVDQKGQCGGAAEARWPGQGIPIEFILWQ